MKIILPGTIVLVLVISTIYIFQTDENEYLRHFNNSKSDVVVSCQVDADCMLSALRLGCIGFASINVSNGKEEIDKFNNKEARLLKTVTFDCAPPPNINDFNAACEENLCVLKQKNMTNE